MNPISTCFLNGSLFPEKPSSSSKTHDVFLRLKSNFEEMRHFREQFDSDSAIISFKTIIYESAKDSDDLKREKAMAMFPRRCKKSNEGNYHVSRQRFLDELLEAAEFFFPKDQYKSRLVSQIESRNTFFKELTETIPPGLHFRYLEPIRNVFQKINIPFSEAYLSKAEAITDLGFEKFRGYLEDEMENATKMNAAFLKIQRLFQDKKECDPEFQTYLKDFTDAYVVMDEMNNAKWHSIWEKSKSKLENFQSKEKVFEILAILQDSKQ